MLVILGESASGKTSLQNILCETGIFKKIVKYTTRPARIEEIEGEDYHFVDIKTFDKLINAGFFVKHDTYNGWKYGLAKKDFFTLQNTISVVTPSEFRFLKLIHPNLISIYLMVDRKSRMINLLNRGDSIDEAYRRNLSDLGQFDGVCNEVNYVIENIEYHKTLPELRDEILRLISRKER